MDFVKDKCIRILYAGETGNAEEIAYDVQSQLPYQSLVCSLSEYDVLDLPGECAVVFIVSTTGDGDIPESMKKFWSFLLRKSLSNIALQGVHYSVFGLGDSSYEKYNAVARKLDKRLQMLGGNELVAVGLGDDQAPFGYLTALNAWVGIVKQNMSNISSIHSLPVKSVVMPSCYTMELSSSSADASHIMAQMPLARESSLLIHATRVVTNERLTASVWEQDVRHIRLRFIPPRGAQDSLKKPDTISLYEVGDVAVIYYENCPALVARAVSVIAEGALRHGGLQLTANTLLEIAYRSSVGQTSRSSRIGSQQNCSLRCLLERYLDIGAVPKRSFFAGLAPYASDLEQADKLRELASPEGTDLYFDYCIKERMNYIDVLEEFPSCRPPLAVLLDLIQTIPARQYSIASSPAMLPNELELCVAISQRRTPYGRKRTGLCSGYLSRLAVDDTVLVSIKPGTLRGTVLCPPSLQDRPLLASTVPMILVGPGTGVAPMRALVQHEICRQRSLAQSIPASGSGPADVNTSPSAHPHISLYFGCRKAQRDFLYGADWSALNSNHNPFKYLTIGDSEYGGESGAACGTGAAEDFIVPGSIRVTTAFSQDQLVKQYVGHKIISDGAELCKLILQGAVIFVAGSAKRMPADVRKAFATVLQQHAPMTPAESEQYLTLMGRKQRYFVEAW